MQRVGRGRIGDAYVDDVFTRAQRLGHRQLERREWLRVRPDVLPVDIDVCQVHDGAEAQCPVPVHGRQLEPTAIPGDAVELDVSLRLPQPGHVDGQW